MAGQVAPAFGWARRVVSAGATAAPLKAETPTAASVAASTPVRRQQPERRAAERRMGTPATTRRASADRTTTTHWLGTVTRDVLQGSAMIRGVPLPPPGPPAPQVLPEQAPSLRRRLWMSLWPRRRRRGACLPEVGTPQPAPNPRGAHTHRGTGGAVRAAARA